MRGRHRICLRDGIHEGHRDGGDLRVGRRMESRGPMGGHGGAGDLRGWVLEVARRDRWIRQQGLVHLMLEVEGGLELRSETPDYKQRRRGARRQWIPNWR